ncbi:MAG: gliding motility-associated C-terminal domain-containing protein [Saprospiraceae bacterium]|nr:gliding motility-associated C-terminal domain-containing protein [Saprospiraceae bacterium]
MKRLFILACVLLVQVTTHLSGQCNRPNPSDNPCNASTFCNTAQLDAFCSVIPTPITNKVYIKPNGFCGSLESPSWFKFIAEDPTLSLSLTAANACGGDGVQAVILSTTNCSDSAAYTAVSDCSNPRGGQPISTITATNLVAGQVYYLLIDGYQGAGCAYTIDVVSGTIRTSTTPLPTPSVIFGPTTVCASATNVTFSVPKVPNATDYRFSITNTTTNASIYSGIRTDSFYTVASFPASGSVRVCVNYKNDCTESTTKCNEVTISTKINITVPTVYLCPGETHILPDGLPVINLSPLTDDVTNFGSDVAGQNGNCDTTFNTTVVSYALREGRRSLFLKPSETSAICNTTITGGIDCGRRDQAVVCKSSATNGCDSIVNTAIFNAKQTTTINPNNPTLNCNNFTLRVAHADTCTETIHAKSYEWFIQTTANAPLSSLNNKTASHVASVEGIYVLVVRDSVYSKAANFAGYRIFTDTIRNTVIGNGGASGNLATPSLINGRTDTTVCQGATVTFKTTSVPNATSYSWSFARFGGRIVGNSTDTSIVVQWAGNTSTDTLYVRAKSICDSSAPQKIVITVVNFANLDAGADRAVCGLQTALTGTSSTNTGTWTVSPATGATLSNSTSPTSNVTVTTAGVYQFIWSESLGACNKSDTVNITFGAPPQYTGFKDSCSITRSNFFVKFNILGGTAPFTVVNTATNASAGTINATGAFVSNPLPIGTYTFQIRDANNCPSANIPASQTCTDCFTKAGIMDTTQALSVCEGDTARATYLGGYNSDGNDTLQFVLHTGNPRTGIVQRSYSPRFGYTTAMSYETRYFISAIAGDDSTRQVKLTDACFSSSAGVSVVFHRKPTASFTLGRTDLCVGSCTTLRYTFTGNAPFTVTTRITDPINRDTIILNRPPTHVQPICPTVNTTYSLVAVSDTFGCATTGLTQQVAVRTFVPIEAGTPRPAISVCSGIDTTVNLLTQLIGALPGGTWSEISAVRSTGTAFNATAASFRTRGQIAGTYRFAYAVSQVNGSPCPADTAVVTMILLSAPTASAGLDDTLTCNKVRVDLGGSNTSTGVNISYAWSGGNAGGNTSSIIVEEPGTYVLTVVSPTCTSRDTVVVYIDTISPKAIITPVTVNTLTCNLDSIILNGSRSTPLGRISYLWQRGSTSHDNNPITEARNGDLYTLFVQSNTNGCIGSDSITINEDRTPPNVVVRTPPLVNCKDSVITIDASASSSGADFSLKWITANGGQILRDSTTLQPKSNSAGFYELTITNNTNGCLSSQFTFVQVDTARPNAIATALDTIDCTSPVVGLSGRGSTLGASITYSWVARPGHITDGENTLNANADEPGTYLLTVQNTKNFCTNTDTATVVRNTERPRDIKLSIKKPSCYGECDANFRIDTVSGGTKPYLYSTDGNVFTTRNLFQNQCAGTFKLYIQDAGGCQIDTTFSVNQDKQLSVSLGADTLLKLGDSLLLKIQTNTDSIENIVWSPVGDSTKCPKGSFCTEQWVRPTSGTTYKAVLTDNSGCSTTGTIRVSIDKKRPIFVPNIFSPDNLGDNNVLMIYGSNVVKIIKRFQIYDRWGNRMFTQQNFKTDDPAFGWDGRLRGRDALPDVYIYFIEIEYLDNTTEILEGDFTLIR